MTKQESKDHMSSAIVDSLHEEYGQMKFIKRCVLKANLRMSMRSQESCHLNEQQYKTSTDTLSIPTIVALQIFGFHSLN